VTVVTSALSEIAEVRLGRQRSPKNHSGPNNRKYLRAANVGWNGLILDDVKVMNFTDAEMEVFRLQRGDLLLSEASGSPTEVGKPAIWMGEIDDCAFQNTLLRVRPGPTVDPRYLLQYLHQQASSGAFARGSRGVGIHHLGREALARWPVPLPAIDEQRRIAAILDHADALRTKRREIMNDLTSLERSIYWSMFEGREWPQVNLTQVCSTPDDVRCGPFGTQLQKSEVVHEGVPLWGIKNVNSGFKLPAFEFLEDATAERLDQYSIIPGDIVMTRKGTIGNCAVYPNTRPSGIMHSDLLRVRPDPTRARPTFVSHQLHHDPKVAAQISTMSSGAIMPGINVGKLKGLQVIDPPLDIQLAFERRIKSLETLRVQSVDCLDRLDNLFASLQSRAFSGQL